ncbi:hypothetical protein, partial [uncultured Bifidobacterium sp.]|uniref:hypothetical protein n=1 Tax=uncultured Bifidobacterium sp. TaxID=165187 RepID=UPI0027DE4326
SYNSTARLRCSFEYLATMTTPPAQGVQHSVTTSSLPMNTIDLGYRKTTTYTPPLCLHRSTHMIKFAFF